MNNMMFGKYIPIDSFIHRLDPRLKIGSLLLLLIAVFFDAGFLGYAILGIFVIIMALAVLIILLALFAGKYAP